MLNRIAIKMIQTVKNLENRFMRVIRKQLNNGLLFFITLRLLGILKDIFLLAEVSRYPDVQNFIVIEPIIYGMGFSTVLVFNSGRYNALFRFKFVVYIIISLTIYIPLVSIFLSYFILTYFEKQYSINSKVRRFWAIILIPNVLYVLFLATFGLDYFLYFLAISSLAQVVYLIEFERNKLTYLDIKKGASIPFIMRPFLISSTRHMIFESNVSNFIILVIKIVQQITGYMSSLFIGEDRDKRTVLYFIFYLVALVSCVLCYILDTIYGAITSLILVFFLESFAIKTLKN